MAVYCRKCGEARGHPFSPVRTSKEPCQYCNGFDQYERKVVVGKRVETVIKQWDNYTYPDSLIEGTASDINKQADKEYEGAPTGN